MSEATSLAVMVESFSKKIDRLSVLKLVALMACETCGGGHTVSECSIVGKHLDPTSRWISLVVRPAHRIESTMRNQQASLQKLEDLVGQIAKLLLERSYTEANPRERVKAIALMS